MKYKLMLITAVGLVLLSGNLLAIENTLTDSTTLQEHQQDKNVTINLNNGQKWKVDPEMMVHIRNMETDVNNFTSTKLSDYKLLSDKLRKNIDLLTSNCTMKGVAHDELHKWLLPYIDLIKEFTEAKDSTEAAKQFQNIKKSFKTFNQYFQ